MDNTRLIELPKILDERGNLTFIEEFGHIPIKISRVVWIYDVPGGEGRHGHCFHTDNRFVVPISGSFEVELEENRSIILNRSNVGLLIPAGVWHRLKNFSTNSVALILCSGIDDTEDYTHDHN